MKPLPDPLPLELVQLLVEAARANDDRMFGALVGGAVDRGTIQPGDRRVLYAVLERLELSDRCRVVSWIDPEGTARASLCELLAARGFVPGRDWSVLPEGPVLMAAAAAERLREQVPAAEWQGIGWLLQTQG